LAAALAPKYRNHKKTGDWKGSMGDKLYQHYRQATNEYKSTNNAK
jgi:hypothetical protein